MTTETNTKTETTAIAITPVDDDAVAVSLERVQTETGIAQDDAGALRSKFAAFYDAISTCRAMAATITDPANLTHQKMAGKLRRELKGVRCEIERRRKDLKANALSYGKAVDGFANVLKYLCEPVEAALEAVEKHAERMEAARIAAIVSERSAALAAEGADPSAFNLAIMDDATFAGIMDNARRAQAEREEAARRAEAERIERENADRLARQRAEAEAAAARAQAAKDREAREKVEAQAKRDRDAAEAKARAEKAAADAKLKAERDAREKAEKAVADAKRQAEEKAEAERQAARRAAAAPDKEKLLALAKAFGDIQMPATTTQAAFEIVATIQRSQAKFAGWIIEQANAL